MKIHVAILATVLAGAMAVSIPAKLAFAEEASDSLTLSTCVEQHFTPADSVTVAHFRVIALVDAQPDDDIRAALADKRDAVIADVAKLLTRLVGHDCKSQFQAINSTASAGSVFKTLSQQLYALSTRRTEGSNAKGAANVLALDLLKKLDSNVVIDLLGTNRQAAAASSTPAVPNTARASTETL
jgi:hypothetical protein